MVVVPFIPLQRTSIECLLYVRGQDIVAVPSSSLVCDMSFMHHCGTGCKILRTGRKRNAERQVVETDTGVTFSHDSANEVFYYNKFV